MSHADALLTILIPTRDRHETLVQVVDVLSSDLPDGVEILVSDNYSAPEARSVLPYRSNVRVIRTDRRMSMPDHWRFALEHVTGKYLTVIGDDDFIWTARLKQVLPLLERDEFELIHWHRGAYFWSSHRNTESAGTLLIYNGTSAKTLTCSRLLGEYFELTGDYQHLPSVYNSLISCKSARKHFGKLSELVPNDCLAPDVSSAFLISRLFSTTLYCNFPVSISGISRFSNGMNPDMQHQFFSEFGAKAYEPSKFSKEITPLSIHGDALKGLLHDFSCSDPERVSGVEPEDLRHVFLMMMAWLYQTNQLGLSIRLHRFLQDKGLLDQVSSTPTPPVMHPLETEVLPTPENFIRLRFGGIDPSTEAKQIALYLNAQPLSNFHLDTST
jgi:hypothetical protein